MFEIGVAVLRKIMPNLPADRAATMAPHLASAMKEFAINTPLRAAAFLAQIAHESGELRYMEEIASGAAYDKRSDLGNTRPEAVRIAHLHGSTPGRFWKGHGPIQTTGYDNHKEAGEALGIDAVNAPGLLASPEHGFRAAGFYWQKKALNSLADLGDEPTHLVRTVKGRRVTEVHPAFDVISFRVNGGWNGRAERRRYYVRALGVLAAACVGGPGTVH